MFAVILEVKNIEVACDYTYIEKINCKIHKSQLWFTDNLMFFTWNMYKYTYIYIKLLHKTASGFIVNQLIENETWLSRQNDTEYEIINSVQKVSCLAMNDSSCVVGCWIINPYWSVYGPLFTIHSDEYDKLWWRNGPLIISLSGADLDPQRNL